MSTFDELRSVLQEDVDDILDRAREYDSRTRFRMLRAAAEHYPELKQPIHRVKAVGFIQGMLATMADRQLPYGTSSDVAARLASIAESHQESLDARRAALNSLALLFLRTKQLTESLDATVRAAFMVSLKSRDAEISEFAAEALSGGGVLSRRSPGRATPLLSVVFPVGRGEFAKILKKLRTRAATRRKLRTQVRSSRNAPARKTHAVEDSARRSP